ncbi:hypothetical protein H920_01027 [Fukomys damarensis]|uniref:Uncharacterized protein n=1 Tax=Fukomys damarensis TaxID=885580 RepID=A0A091E2G4_FUKDA|nr:hypothetical protein H920_01027 [Fukomys damarensis]
MILMDGWKGPGRVGPGAAQGRCAMGQSSEDRVLGDDRKLAEHREGFAALSPLIHPRGNADPRPCLR